MPRPHLVETLTRNAAVIGGLVTAIVAVVQLARDVSQSVREFEWKQAEQGRALVKAMLTDEGWDAMTMLAFSEGRKYEIAPDTKVLIRPSDVLLTLKSSVSERAERTETQRFIIDRYDRLFFLVSQLQVAVRSRLVRKGDVAFPLELVRGEAALPPQASSSRLHEGERGVGNNRLLRLARQLGTLLA